MKNRFLILIFLFSTIGLCAQTKVKKDEAIIHITGYVVSITDHKFDLNITKEGNSVKITYTYCDSIKFKEVRKDPESWRLNSAAMKYVAGTPTRLLMNDSIGLIIEKHKEYTQDSITLNLKEDKSYENLLRRVISADKAELTPAIERHVLDGYDIFIRIITKDKSLFTGADNPRLNTHPLLFDLITTTLNKYKDCSAVKKIRKCYTGF